MIVTGIPNQEMALRIIRIYTYILERINSDQSLTLENINSWPLTVPASQLQLLQTPIGWITIPYEVLTPKFTLLEDITFSATTEFELYLFQSLFIFTDLTYFKTGNERVVDYFLATKKESEIVVVTPTGPRIINISSPESNQQPESSADETTKREATTTTIESAPLSKQRNHRVYFGARKLERHGYNYGGYKYTQLETINGKEEEEEEYYLEEELYPSRKESRWSKFKYTTEKPQDEQEEEKENTAITAKEEYTLIDIITTTSTSTTQIKPATPTSELVEEEKEITTITTKEDVSITEIILTTSTRQKIIKNDTPTLQSTHTNNSNEQTGVRWYGGIGALEMNYDNSSSEIYQIIVKAATNHQTGNLSEPVSLQDINYKAFAKGYTAEHLTTCIEEYIYLNIWYLVDNGATLMITPMKCKKKFRGRRRR